MGRDLLVASRPTPDMIDFFEKRTRAHIERVQRYLCALADRNQDLRVDLLIRAKDHDVSKWTPDEREPYIWITHKFRCKDDGRPYEPRPTPEMEKRIEKVVQKHYSSNQHHPEFYASLSDMTEGDLAEMVADWAAMAAEHGEKSPRGWADTHIGSRWAFDDDQKAAIYRFIEQVEALR